MDYDIERVVEAIHGNDYKMWLITTGGGETLISWLHGVGGSSNTMVGSEVPYSSAASKYVLWDGDIASFNSDKSVTDLVSLRMAEVAYRKAKFFSDSDGPFLGVGVTAALATNRVRRGIDHAFISLYTDDGAYQLTCELTFYTKHESYSREAEEISLSRTVLAEIAKLMDCMPTNFDRKSRVMDRRHYDRNYEGEANSPSRMVATAKLLRDAEGR